MNKHNLGKQSGFTLIELIVVIVILGILAATALPKFADLGKDARISSINAAKGSLAATAAMAHGKYLVTSPAPSLVTFEGVDIAFSAASFGYPVANANLALADGLNDADYTATIAGTTLTVSPKSAPAAATCNVTYTQPALVDTAPAITLTTTGC